VKCSLDVFSEAAHCLLSHRVDSVAVTALIVPLWDHDSLSQCLRNMFRIYNVHINFARWPQPQLDHTQDCDSEISCTTRTSSTVGLPQDTLSWCFRNIVTLCDMNCTQILPKDHSWVIPDVVPYCLVCIKHRWGELWCRLANALVAVSKGIRAVKLCSNKNRNPPVLKLVCQLTPIHQYNDHKTVVYTFLIMVALCNRADHYIFVLWFLSFFFFSSPNLSRGRLDVCHSSTHGVALVRFGPLAAEIYPVVWGTPANFNRFRVLAALLHGV